MKLLESASVIEAARWRGQDDGVFFTASLILPTSFMWDFTILCTVSGSMDDKEPCAAVFLDAAQ
jgi:hypothetical protein